MIYYFFKALISMKYYFLIKLFITLIDLIDSKKGFPFVIESDIKSGGCGHVLRGRSKYNPRQLVAIKAEQALSCNLLEKENQIYQDLQGAP